MPLLHYGMKYTKYTRELLEPVVMSSNSFSQVCKKLGKKPVGAMWELIKSKVHLFDIDTSHFTGQAFHTGYNHTGKAQKRTPEKLLTEGKIRREPGRRLREALLEIGRTDCCAECGLTGDWNGKPITLEVDHIDWDWSNCRPENLQLLCPNCHSQRKRVVS